MSTTLDLTGRPVVVGDRIAYAATDGRSSGLRVGKITEIVEAHQKVEKYWTTEVPTKLRVEVEVSSGFVTIGKPVLIEAGFKRFVKLA